MFAIAAILGLAFGAVAYRKGYSLFFWWLYGFVVFILPTFLFGPIVGIVIYFVVLIILYFKNPNPRKFKKCDSCAEIVRIEAVKCKHCGGDLPHTR
ncbi:zinc ribbon domain-containing protein [Brenneria populi]|uniref:Zinc ribbon domain-containing protein n=1 Tax=Brenneria populi TaxID=1505588 RepID=A0ABU6JSX5_9GAMM|nr:zinc ribbon domain-containing protein [Brenneria populi Li et al. 2015]